MLPFRYLRRYREIVSALTRHGLGWMTAMLGLNALVPFHRGFLGHPRREDPYSAPEHLRLAFEELGPTFIKLAQILSTRPDLISPAYAKALTKLQDRVAPLPFERMSRVLEEELGKDYRSAFAEFEQEPLGSASIAQVYRAKLASGERVVVKVQKPDLRPLIDQDISILKDLARRISNQTEWGKLYDLEGLLDEFAFSLSNELNYEHEGQNADRLRKIHRTDARVFVPKVFWKLTTSKVLVMEEVQGKRLEASGGDDGLTDLERRRLAKTATMITLKEVFEHGFFHADPHQGNFVIMERNTIGLIDFGMIGVLSQEYREAFLRFAAEMARGNSAEMIDALWDLGITGKDANRPALRRDLNHLLYRFREGTFAEMAAGDMLGELMAIAFRHKMQFPSDLALLFKVLMMNEGVAAMIDPQFRLFEFAEPYLHRLARRRFSPRNLTKLVEDEAADLAELASGLTKRTSRLLQRLETGDIQITVEQPDTDRIRSKTTAAINRLTMSLALSLYLITIGIYILIGHFMGFGHLAAKIFLALIALGGLHFARVQASIWRQGRL